VIDGFKLEEEKEVRKAAVVGIGGGGAGGVNPNSSMRGLRNRKGKKRNPASRRLFKPKARR